ncbi:MAG: putative Ig domain-containing protein [Acidobacteriota bacterium]
MKPNRLISSGLVACCLTFLFVLFITARSDGSRFGSLTDCSGCHSGVSNPPGGAAFGNVPSSYTPGQSYSMTLDLSGGSVYGFQVGASNSADSRVGTLSSTTANTVVTTSGLLTHVKPSTAGAPVSLQVQASDPDGNPLTYSATGLPPGLSINSTSGLISGTLSSSASGTSSVSISVSDGTATANVAFNWTISPSNPVNYTDSLYFAQFGNGSSTGAPAQARVYSRLTLVNLSPSEPVHARVKIRKDNGELLPVAFNGNPTPGSLELEIPAAGSAVLRTDGIGQLETGSVVVDSDRPLSGIIVVGGDLGQVAYADNGPVFSFLAPVTENGLGMGADAETVRVGISIMNLEDEAVTLNLELLDTEGHLKASAQVVLPPNGHLARFLDELSWSGAVHLDGTLRGSTAGARHLAVTVVGAAPNGFWSVPVIPQQ